MVVECVYVPRPWFHSPIACCTNWNGPKGILFGLWAWRGMNNIQMKRALVVLKRPQWITLYPPTRPAPLVHQNTDQSISPFTVVVADSSFVQEKSTWEWSWLVLASCKAVFSLAPPRKFPVISRNMVWADCHVIELGESAKLFYRLGFVCFQVIDILFCRIEK